MKRQRSFLEEKATLYLVPTPIGNLEDMTFRAVTILKEVALIYAEDTRTSKVLLNHYAINTPLRSYHMHNEASAQDEILKHLEEGKSVALISDAGMPLVSDPGELLVKKVKTEGYYVVALPGASASLTALVASGIKTQPFTFIGFLPNKKNARLTLLKSLKTMQSTLIFYEAPHRFKETLQAMHEVFGKRDAALLRELTKRYEEIITFSLDEHEAIEPLKGEMVIVIEGFLDTVDLSEEDMIEHVELLIADGLKEMDAIKQVAKARQLKKNTVYMAYQTHKTHFKNDFSEDDDNG